MGTLRLTTVEAGGRAGEARGLSQEICLHWMQSDSGQGTEVQVENWEAKNSSES